MALLLHVEFNASSEPVATKMLELLARMANIVHRDYPEVYTYVFRREKQIATKLFFTELYANEQAFLQHASDPEFSHLYREAFTREAGKSQKELCLRNDITTPLLPITANILEHYLHVTYIPIHQGFFHQKVPTKIDHHFLIVCTGCDENVYAQFNELMSCVTCVTFEEAGGNGQLIAVVTGILDRKDSLGDSKPSIDTMELVCSDGKTTETFQNIMTRHFQVRSLDIQTSFSGYIHHQSS